ncbi:hypothetical protein [Crenobacter cavernae]|nr:hypothetical protein [Crenobacter cavernae]AXK39473.1 hypothetical protein DWG20_08520 [Crenobacter cavernae]
MSVQGVGQVNQIAGSANTSNNSADILVSTQPVNTAAPTAPGPNWQEANAGMAGVTLHDNQLRIEINKGAAGNSFQNIGQGQVLQFTRIQGNNMAVENSLQIQIGVRPDLSTQQQLAMQSYHSMLTGMR